MPVKQVLRSPGVLYLCLPFWLYTLDTLRKEKDRNREARECFFAKRLVSPEMQTDYNVCLSVISIYIL